ncbi:molybdopterin dinucleotide binding domain-containing protein, partial [Chloroflexota bacterium]
YVLGIEDGIPKTPSWAEIITGVPASTIEDLARLYATTKPAALLSGWGPGRSATGEQYHRLAITLAAMTGNIGVLGGGSGALGRCPHPSVDVSYLPEGENPVEGAGKPQSDRLPLTLGAYPVSASLHTNEVFDAILKGKAGGYPADYKLLYVATRGLLNQVGNINQGVQALKSLEFIVVQEQFMTSTAKFADILLPVNTSLERNDIGRSWPYIMYPYYIYYNKAIGSLYESKSDFEICCELAPRLGIYNYSDKTEDEWLREIAKSAEGFGDYDVTKQKGVQKIHLSRPIVSFEEQIDNLADNPFPTASGKIEIYSQRLAEMKNPLIPPIPKYIENWEGLNDPLIEKYPLQLITPHARLRAHSGLHNIPWLRELEPHAIWLNSADAQARGISQGDKVRVFNDRGEVVMPALVTERIVLGVVSIGQGAWYEPDDKGIDKGGCANVLTKEGRSPGGAFPCNTCLVELEKV